MTVNMRPNAELADLRGYLDAGNAANAARNWQACQENYAQALKLDPKLASIWVQYGHALKEQGFYKDAEAAYRRAIELVPDSADSWLQLGHVLKLQGKLKTALTAYARAYDADPTARDPQIELAHLTRIDFAGLGPARADVLAPERVQHRGWRQRLALLAARLGSWHHQGNQIRSIWPSGEIALGPKVAVFVHYDPEGCVQDFALNYVRALQAAGLSVAFVSNCPDLAERDLARLRPLCAAIILRRNVGYDFGAARDALRVLGLPRADTDYAVIANDSVYGPLQPLGPMLERIDFSAADLWGATDNWQHRYHLQSYFLVAGRAALESAAWKQFWGGMRLVQSRDYVIQAYEIGLTGAMMRGGLRCAALWEYRHLLVAVPAAEAAGGPDLLVSADPAEEMRRGHLARIRNNIVAHTPMNPTGELWRLLLLDGFPFIKRELLRSNPARVADLADWRAVVGAVSDADLAPIEQQLRREMRDRAI